MFWFPDVSGYLTTCNDRNFRRLPYATTTRSGYLPSHLSIKKLLSQVILARIFPEPNRRLIKSNIFTSLASFVEETSTTPAIGLEEVLLSADRVLQPLQVQCLHLFVSDLFHNYFLYGAPSRARTGMTFVGRF